MTTEPLMRHRRTNQRTNILCDYAEQYPVPRPVWPLVVIVVFPWALLLGVLVWAL